MSSAISSKPLSTAGAKPAGRRSKGRRGGGRKWIESEHELQVAVFRWASMAQCTMPELRWMFAVPNGMAARSPVTVSRMKAEGLRNGVLDVWLPAPRRGYTGLVIEHKHGSNTLTKEQKEWAAALAAFGWLVVVSYSFDESKRAIEDYLRGGNGSAAT